MNHSPFDTEAWEGSEPTEYEQDLQAAEAAGDPWFSFATWAAARARLQQVPARESSDDPDQDIPF
jgi:hypothetical protein